MQLLTGLSLGYGAPVMTGLADIYHDYIACLNRRDWAALDRFVAQDVHYNDQEIGLAGYLAMLEGNVRNIPDLRFRVGTLVCQPPQVASRLLFDCTPIGTFLGLPIEGRRVSFVENVFYRFRGERIAAVWSIVDREAIVQQL